jgi:hypothetical protein
MSAHQRAESFTPTARCLACTFADSLGNFDPKVSTTAVIGMVNTTIHNERMGSMRYDEQAKAMSLLIDRLARDIEHTVAAP